MSELDIIKNVMIESVKNRFNKITERPRIVTEYGFSVDGRRSDKDNFKELFEYLKDQGHTHAYIRDADNNTIEASVEQIEMIYKNIIQYSFDLYQRKWLIFQDIAQATSIDEINNLNIELLPTYEDEL